MRNPFLDMLQKAVNVSGMSNAEIAREAGMERSTVGRILAGDRVPNSYTLGRIAEALSLEPGTYDLLEKLRKTAVQLRNQQTRSTDELPIMQKRNVEVEA